MNVLVSSNEKYLRYTATMLVSLSISNNIKSINVWFLHYGISQPSQDKFSQYLEKYNIYTKFISLPDEYINRLEAPGYIDHISKETYYRLFAQFLLPNDIERILWIDSDIIVKGDIQAFYNQNLTNHALIACENMGEHDNGNARRLGLDNDFVYFNAGVILFNLKYLRENSTPDMIFEFCRNNKSILKMQDQDVLNMLYGRKSLVLTDQIYNCMTNSPESFISPDICNKAAILHYAGWQKPWVIRWQNDYSRYYWNVREIEGMSIHDKWTKFMGSIWYHCCGNKIFDFICLPYNWVKSRL